MQWSYLQNWSAKASAVMRAGNGYGYVPIASLATKNYTAPWLR
jgi:hypothetical protein